MAKATQPVWAAPSAAAKLQRTIEEDQRLGSVILNAIGTRYFIDARLDGSISDGTIEMTTQGAPTMNLTVVDPDNELLNSDLFARRIDTVVDGIPFRLVEVSRQEDEVISLQYEHRLVSYLREHLSPRKVSRGSKTRAEFAYSLVLEVKKGGLVQFVSPDVHKVQPRAAKIDQPTKDARKTPGFPDNPTGVKIKNAPATRSQLKNVDKALGVAAALKASPLATKAMVCAGIGESSFVVQMNQGGSPYGGVFQGKVRGGPWDINDTEGMAESFLKGGKGFQGGGAMALAKRRPPLSPGQIAYMVEGDLSNFGGNTSAAARFYDKWGNEADRLIDAWRGEALSTSDSGSPKFEFTRGKMSPGDAPEDSWMALQRLASDVRWRCFIVGAKTVYFISDDQLMRSRPLYFVQPGDQGVRSVTFDMEVGKRTIIYKGRRERKPSEAILKVRLGRWAAPPGSVVELAGYGLADGRWLVDSVSRPIFDSDAEIHLRQPQKALPEPAHSTTSGGGSGASAPSSDGGPAQSTGSGSDDTVTRVYVAAKSISAQNLPYVWGGGHARVGVPDGGTGRDKGPGYDCSGSVAAALDAAGILPGHRVMVSGGFASSWGDPGEGKGMTVWANSQHVWIEFKGRNAKRFDTSPRGSGPRGPQLRFTARPDGRSEGFTPRHWKGT